MGEMAGRVDERQHHVNLFEGLDAAPVVGEGERLLVADRATPEGEIGGVKFVWLECVGRDFSTAYRGIAVVSAAEPAPADPAVAVYAPASARYAGQP